MSQRFPDVEERRRRRHRTLIYVILGTLPFYFCGIVLLVGFSGASSAPPETAEALLTETGTITVTPSRTPGGPTLTLGATPTQFSPPTASATFTRTPTPNLDATATLRALLTQGANSLTGTAIARTQQVGGTATAQFQATATAFAQRTATANAIATATAAAQQTASANRPPSAEDDRATTQRDTPVTINVLANDSDPDGDAVRVIAFGDRSEAGGRVECSQDACRYTPPQGFTGTDRFVYTAGDGRGGTDQATVTVEVTAPENRPPDANNDTAETRRNQAVVIDVLANDSDPDGDSLQIIDVDETSNEGGSVECLTRGTCVYTPPEGFTGTDTFAYTVGDGRGGQDTALVDVRVTE